MQAVVHTGEVLLVCEAGEQQRHVSEHVTGKRLPSQRFTQGSGIE
jgi:hypothetical protein